MSGAHVIRSYADGRSAVHRAPASAKLALALVVVVAVAVVPAPLAPWAAFVLVPVAIIARLANVPLGTFAARVALVQPFVLGVAILSLFQERGLGVFLALATKSVVSVATLQLLAHTTPFADVLRVLRRAHVPDVLVVVLSLLHRYLFVVVEESRRMQRARRARSLRKGSWQALASVIGVSFARSIARAERIHIAMRARGAS